MRILFLVPYPLGKAPSQRFRFEQYLETLKEKKHSYIVQSFLDEDAWTRIYKRGNLFLKVVDIVRGYLRRFLILFKTSAFDVVFIHREAAPLGPPFFEWFIARVLRKKIVYDFDDAIWIPNTSEENKIIANLKWHQKVGSICNWSYKVSCGSEYLCSFANRHNGHAIYNPTTIDTEHLHNPGLYEARNKRDKKITIGWTGSHSTLHYLDELVPILAKLEDSLPFRFVVIANKNPELPIKSFEFKTWDVSSEIEDLLEFDIGIMPLRPDQWSEGKCGFKALQYMSLGIPAVVSPVGVNKEIVTHGVEGYHCTTDSDWESHLAALIQDEGLRKQLGSNGRKKVEEQFSVLANQERFLSLFE